MHGSSPSPDRRWSRSILIALVVFLYLPVAYRCGWLVAQKATVDFPAFWYAGVLTFDQDKTPYGKHAFDEASAEMWQHVHPYIYPPPSLLVSWPLSRFPFPTAQALFLTASHLCYLACIWLLLRKLMPMPPPGEFRDRVIGVSLVYLLLFDPAWSTLEVGQINLITMFFICLALVAIREDRAGWQTALPLSLAILLKTYPVLLLIPLALRRRWTAIALTCVFFGVYAAAAALSLKPEVWSTWLHEVVPKGGYTKDVVAVAGPWNQNINAFVTRIFVDGSRFEGRLSDPVLAKMIATGLAGLVFVVTSFVAFRSSRRDDRQERADLEIAAFLLMIFLIAPLSWDHHLVYILPAAVLAVSLLLRGQLNRTTGLVVTAALLLIAWRLPLWEPSPSFSWETLFISTKFYAVIALWLFVVIRLWRLGSDGAPRAAEAGPAVLVEAQNRRAELTAPSS